MKALCPMSRFAQQLETLPYLGFGLGIASAYVEPLLAHQSTVDMADQVEWVELIAENVMGKGGLAALQLETLLEAGFPIVSHGVNLSLGSVDGLNPAYITQLQGLFKRLQPVWFSDHLSFGSVEGRYFSDLMPLPFTPEAVALCVVHIQQIQTQFSQLFLIENISYYAECRTAHGMSEAQFLTAILEQADCGLLLDVNNVYVNAKNHGYDPIAFMQALPLHRVVEIHIAGHLPTPELIIDTHGEAVCPEVLDLFAWLYPRCPNLKGVLLERDSNLPPFDELLAELNTVRQVALQAQAVQGMLI
jgi:uncharacterized protein (UPF0276 family)